jgi:hypothetical protein
MSDGKEISDYMIGFPSYVLFDPDFGPMKAGNVMKQVALKADSLDHIGDISITKIHAVSVYYCHPVKWHGQIHELSKFSPKSVEDFNIPHSYAVRLTFYNKDNTIKYLNMSLDKFLNLPEKK